MQVFEKKHINVYALILKVDLVVNKLQIRNSSILAGKDLDLK